MMTPPPSRLSLIKLKKCTMNVSSYTQLATIQVANRSLKGLLITGLMFLLPSGETHAEGIDFRSKIQPIFAEHCSQCHGVDEAKREGGLRLDTREGGLAGGESGAAAIVPGKSAESELVRRILSEDLETMMPPPSEKKPLSPEQKVLLRRWIDEGADYQKHWAFVPPAKTVTGKNTIDESIQGVLELKGWKANPPAEPWELYRRLYLDLLGIPPSPEQLEQAKQDGLEVTVDKLLRDQAYGEKWARPWLDVARYSDTNGYEKDLQRDQWAWRDWVIDAINRDMPYDQFVIEQIAGDLLPDANQETMIATGFLRNSMINEEGAIVPEQFRMVEMFDRMDCIGKSVLGMSLQCAQCHTHKFDPITHDEYYGMFAFLNNTFEARSWVYTPEQLNTIREIRDRVQGELKDFLALQNNWREGFSKWRNEILKARPAWLPLHAELLETISGLNHPVQEHDESILMVGHSSNDIFMLAPSPLETITGLQFEVLSHDELPFRGPGRNGVGMWDLREVELFVQRPGNSDWEKQKFSAASADFSNAEEKSADGKSASGPATLLIDGKDETTWKSDRGSGLRNQASVAVLQLEKPLENLKDCKLKVVWRQGDMVGCCRISVTNAPAPTAPHVDHDAVLAMLATGDGIEALPNDKALFAWIAGREDAKSVAERIHAEWKRFPNAKTSVLHMRERDGKSTRTTYTLARGNWNQPINPVQPRLLASFHQPSKPQSSTTDTEEVPARLRLARWLVDRESPLAARVAVNRVWQNLFGQGLVETSEDFGTRAPVPEYQSILDNLAVEFMESGWSQKQLLKKIVMSDAYQRSSRATPELLERDPKNRWLTRGPRFRCDAETVRDIALSVSGLLHQKVGGPSVIPPVPQNVLDYNYVYPGYWNPAQGPERYRRALYMFRKRSMPDPVLSAFDAPNGDLSCARRVRSNTPLAALTGLNEPIFVESAQAMAIRILNEAKPDDLSRIDRAFLLATSRSPSDREREELMKYIQVQRKRLADGWVNPREILTGDASKLRDLPQGTTPQDAAAWTLAARIILNLDETMTKQ